VYFTGRESTTRLVYCPVMSSDDTAIFVHWEKWRGAYQMLILVAEDQHGMLQNDGFR